MDELSDWRNSYLTQLYFTKIKEKILEYEEFIGSGRCLIMDDMQGTFAAYARNCGIIEGLKKALEM